MRIGVDDAAQSRIWESSLESQRERSARQDRIVNGRQRAARANGLDQPRVKQRAAVNRRQCFAWAIQAQA